jgi:hypothetical protein
LGFDPILRFFHNSAMTLIPSARHLVDLACTAILITSWFSAACRAGTRETATFGRLKAALDAIPAIDTHEHLRSFEKLADRVKTEQGSIPGNTKPSRMTRTISPGRKGLK